MIYKKYNVQKVKGETDPTAEYFVLRIDTDEAARGALLCYANSMRSQRNDVFAKELEDWIGKYSGD